MRLLTLQHQARRRRPRAAARRRHHRAAPDVVVLQEATRPAVVERLARATGMIASGAAARPVARLSEPRADRRAPLGAPAVVAACVSRDLVPRACDVRIFGVHLSAVHAAWTEARRVRELRSLLAAIGDRVARAHVLVGDFNTLAPDERLDVTRLPRRLRLLVWLSGGRIRWQTIAIMLGAGYIDGYRQLHASRPGLTFPTWDPHVRLDYVFLPKALASRLTRMRGRHGPPGCRLGSLAMASRSLSRVR